MFFGAYLIPMPIYRLEMCQTRAENNKFNLSRMIKKLERHVVKLEFDSGISKIQSNPLLLPFHSMILSIDRSSNFPFMRFHSKPFSLGIKHHFYGSTSIQNFTG